MKNLIFIIFSFILLTLSCVKEVKLNKSGLPHKVVVNGFICPDSIVRIHVTLTGNMQEDITGLNNAVVKLYKNGDFLFNLNLEQSGWYSVNLFPQAGNTYKVEVIVPGYEMVYAETDIPVFPSITTAWYEKNSTIPDGAGIYEARTFIVFQDDPLSANFYLPGKNRFLYEQTKETDESILTDSDLNYNPHYYYFSDAMFNGQQKTLTLYGGGIIQNMFSTIYYQQDYKIRFTIISEPYYKALKSWSVHYYNQNSDQYTDDPLTLLFLGDPIPMYSNVTGGYGVFAGYNAKKIPVEAHQ